MPLVGPLIFVGAFLSFWVEPLLGKALLPRFGGAPAVWTTCLVFFQAALLAGYAGADLLSRRLGRRAQGAVLGGWLLLAALTLFAPAFWRGGAPLVGAANDGDGPPALGILRWLSVSVGPAFVALAGVGPLLQSWLGGRLPPRRIVRLYALSSIGSMAALVAYPVLLEPALPIRPQGLVWVVAFLIWAAGVAAVALRRPPSAAAPPAPVVPSPKPARGTVALWMALPACSTVLLLAVSNAFGQEVSVSPLLWTLPLAIYLGTFVLSFDLRRWYRRGIFLPLFALSGIAAVIVTWRAPTVGTAVLVGVHAALLLSGGMLCHGELARLVPGPAHLTRFYLALAAGGALGGLLAGVGAPLVFSEYHEMTVGILAVWIVPVLAMAHGGAVLRDERWRAARFGLGTCLIITLLVLSMPVRLTSGPYLYGARNFWGVLHVGLDDDAGRPAVALMHGHTLHGFQLREPARRREPTGYFVPGSGIGRVLRTLHELHPGSLRVGVVGLGVGTLAAWGRAGDELRFYEVDPEVIRLARGAGGYFSFLGDSAAHIDVVAGDARVSLERELRAGGAQRFDLLVMDAFNSAAVPVHLLTREAMRLYAAHLAPGGVLVVHTSNRHLRLAPLALALGAELGMQGVALRTRAEGGGAVAAASRAEWTVLARDPTFLQRPALREAAVAVDGPLPRAWTDDHSALFDVLR